LDPSNPPKLSEETKARLDAMTPAEIEANAEADPDNPPITDEEFSRGTVAQFVKMVRARTGLSQGAFAVRFRINAGRLRDIEQGRSMPDTAFLAYLRVIQHEPEAVARALKEPMRG
jgi:putative transcriptional regulator